ncbi:hypothetical protein Rpal_3100 [Rhodopseudomonas palustris TIE-1]|uniref:oxidoreductase n=1 Tax=Rhodopseudomonas palustris TaxID=1076 RepID=UPI000164AAB3|nr:oxidoreductase [Rhodopseudomonas palustris]ACF01606.1 hypothetical protein Rpal_3100 [Rhodopseudomonas palustris TIE-1]
MNERTRFGYKVAEITGGASASAPLPHAEGASLIIGDLDAAAGNSLVTELGDEHTRFITTDVSDFASVTALIDGAVESNTIEPSLAIDKQLSLRFVLGYGPGEFAVPLHAIAEGHCDVSPLISGTVGPAHGRPGVLPFL